MTQNQNDVTAAAGTHSTPDSDPHGDAELHTRLRLLALNRALPHNCEARSLAGRIYYLNHDTKTVSWLPPEIAWHSSYGLPYGVESALDRRNKEYFINHVEQTTSYEDARAQVAPERTVAPRIVHLVKDANLNCGFVAGSESPVVVKDVMSRGPSDGLLQVDDEILEVNGQDVSTWSREKVVQLIKAAPLMVSLKVQQPSGSSLHKKSALLSASKKAKLRKSSLPRVRFAADVESPQSVATTPSHSDVLDLLPNSSKNGAPSALLAALASMTSSACAATSNMVLQKNGTANGTGGGGGAGCSAAGGGGASVGVGVGAGAGAVEKLPPVLPDVIRVFLENGQTKAIRYDRKTTVRDVLKSLLVKLHIKMVDYFSLVLFHASSATNSDLIVLKGEQRICDVAEWPGVQRCQCVLRVVLHPKDPSELLQDEEAFEYFYLQSCNDVLVGFFSGDIKDDRVACQLAAIHMWQYALRMHIDADAKGILGAVEKHCNLAYFLPRAHHTRLDKTLRKLLAVQARPKCIGELMQTILGTSPNADARQLPFSERQLQLAYLRLLSSLASYGSRTFVATCIDSSCDVWLVVSPRSGIAVRNSSLDAPVRLIAFEHINYLLLKAESERMRNVELHLGTLQTSSSVPLTFSMTIQEARDFCFFVAGYRRLAAGTAPDSFVRSEDGLDGEENSTDPPPYNERHRVVTTAWSYADWTQPTHTVQFRSLPSYESRACSSDLQIEQLCALTRPVRLSTERCTRHIAIQVCNENGEPSEELCKLDSVDRTQDVDRRQSIIDLRATPLDNRSSSSAAHPANRNPRPRSLQSPRSSPLPFRLEQLEFTDDTDESSINAVRVPPPPGFGDESSDISISSSSSSIPSSISPENHSAAARVPGLAADRELVSPSLRYVITPSDSLFPIVSISSKVHSPGSSTLQIPSAHGHDTKIVTSHSDLAINDHAGAPVFRVSLSPRTSTQSVQRPASPARNSFSKLFHRSGKSASVDNLAVVGNTTVKQQGNITHTKVPLNQPSNELLAKSSSHDQSMSVGLTGNNTDEEPREATRKKPRRTLSLDRIARSFRKLDGNGEEQGPTERSRSPILASFKRMVQRKRIATDTADGSVHDASLSIPSANASVQIKMPLVTSRRKPIPIQTASASASVNTSPIKVPQRAPAVLANGDALQPSESHRASQISQTLAQVLRRDSYDIDTINVEAVDDLTSLQSVANDLLESINSIVTQMGNGLSSSTTNLDLIDTRETLSDEMLECLSKLLKLGKDIAIECRLLISCSLRFELDPTVTFSITLMQLFARVLNTFNDVSSAHKLSHVVSHQHVSRAMKIVHGLLNRFKKVLVVFSQCYKSCLLVVVENRRNSIHTVNEWATKLAEALSHFVEELSKLCDRQKRATQSGDESNRDFLLRNANKSLSSEFKINNNAESSTC